MRDRKLDRLFDRFRKDGDAPALGKVFDATASELLQVAVHLVRDPGDAEDLLQATFLTAIERASSYDGDRRLVPWLIGIMVRHAHNLRRTKRREVDPDRLAAGVVAAPEDQLQADEFADSIKKALAGLSPSYQAVLEPYLLHGERAVDIARKSGVAPGTVRVQIRRGLIAFRRALPAGLAPGAVVLLGGRSIAEVRLVVLNSAAKHAGSASVASLSTTTLLAGIAVSKKIIVATVSTLLLVLVGWIGGAGDWLSPDLGESLGQGDGKELSLALDSGSLRGAEAKTEVLTPKEPAQVESKDRELVPASYKSFLAGVEGRLVHFNGEPASDIQVVLLEIDASLLTTPMDAAFDGVLDRAKRLLLANPQVASARTSADGSFSLSGAHLSGVHALGFDLGGARPAGRILDQALHSGEVTDVGTIVLAETHSVQGRAVDKEGNGIAGVRVRAATLPNVAFALVDVREASALILGRSDELVTVSLPAFAMSLLEMLPIPATQTDEAGYFELLGVPKTGGALFLDSPGFEPARHGVSGADTNIGESVMVRLGSIDGRVLDMAGSPVVGAQVRGGPHTDVEIGRESLVVTQGELLTDEMGHFQFLGQPDHARNSVAVRRSPTSPWVITSTFKQGDTIRIPDEWSLRLHVKDSSGAAIPGAEVLVASSHIDRGLQSLLGAQSAVAACEEVKSGEYTLRGLYAESYRIVVRADGFLPASTGATITGDWQTETITLDRAAPRSVRVVDTRTGRPIQGARVSFYRLRSALGSSSTDSDGRAVVNNIPIEGKGDITLRVSHPGYATSFGSHAPSSGDVEIGLDRGGSVEFRVLVGGQPPETPIGFRLSSREKGRGPDAQLPSFAITNGEGVGNLDGLTPGKYAYKASVRFLDADPLLLFSQSFFPRELARGEVLIVVGETVIINIELEPAPEPEQRPALASGVFGAVSIEGGDSLGMSVLLFDQNNGPNGLQLTQELDAGGNFVFDDIPPGKYALYLVPPSEGVQIVPLSMKEVAVKFGRAEEVDFNLHPIELVVKVVDADGRPCKDALVKFTPTHTNSTSFSSVQTLGDGTSLVTVWGHGEYSGLAESKTEGIAHFKVTISPDGAPDLKLQLSRGVPCAGNLNFPSGLLSGSQELEVTWIRTDTYGVFSRQSVTFLEGSSSFEIVGMPPGPYTLYVGTAEGVYKVDVEVPEAGADDLDLKLVPNQL